MSVWPQASPESLLSLANNVKLALCSSHKHLLTPNKKSQKWLCLDASNEPYICTFLLCLWMDHSYFHTLKSEIDFPGKQLISIFLSLSGCNFRILTEVNHPDHFRLLFYEYCEFGHATLFTYYWSVQFGNFLFFFFTSECHGPITRNAFLLLKIWDACINEIEKGSCDRPLIPGI